MIQIYVLDETGELEEAEVCEGTVPEQDCTVIFRRLKNGKRHVEVIGLPSDPILELMNCIKIKEVTR